MISYLQDCVRGLQSELGQMKNKVLFQRPKRNLIARMLPLDSPEARRALKQFDSHSSSFINLEQTGGDQKMILRKVKRVPKQLNTVQTSPTRFINQTP